METLMYIGGIIFLVFLVISVGAYSYMLYTAYKIKNQAEKFFGKKVAKTAEKIIDKKIEKHL
jgi:hypothetical protein